MRLLVIQEQHFFRLPNGEVWVDKQSDVHFWDRYLSVFEEIVVCGRMRDAAKPGNKALRSDRPEVSYIGMPDFRGISGLVKNYARIQHALKEAISKADCIIFRAPSPISMVSYAAVKNSGKPFAVELMNNPKTHYSRDAMPTVYQPIISSFVTNQTKRICKSANGVAYVTKEALQRLYPSRARVNGETKNAFEASYSTINLSRSQFVKPIWDDSRPSPVVLVHSGEMVDYRKGQNVFIETLSILKNKGYNVRGILIGDGEKRIEFENLTNKLSVSDAIEFVGWKSGFSEVQKELLKGHIFVFPSRGEGLPRSVIEAMASGLLCFGSNIDGVPELLDDDLLVEDFTAESFVNRIVPYLENWQLACRKRDILFERAQAFCSENLKEARDSFYRKLRDACR